MGSQTSKSGVSENILISLSRNESKKIIIQRAIEKKGAATGRDLKKVAARPPPPPPPKKKCSEEYVCQMEDLAIASLNKIVQMSEEITAKYNLSVEGYEEKWNSIEERSNLLSVKDVPTFERERAKIMEAFQEKNCANKKQACQAYKEAVDKHLQSLAKKTAGNLSFTEDEKK